MQESDPTAIYLAAVSSDSDLALIDLFSGDCIWSHQLPQGPASISVGGGEENNDFQLFVIASNSETSSSFMGAYDVNTGSMLWNKTNPNPNSLASMAADQEFVYVRGYSGAEDTDGIQAYSQSTGFLFWQSDDKGFTFSSETNIALIGSSLMVISIDPDAPRTVLMDQNGVTLFVKPFIMQPVWAVGFGIFFAVVYDTDSSGSPRSWIGGFSLENGATIWQVSNLGLSSSGVYLALRPTPSGGCNLLVTTATGLLLELSTDDGQVLHTYDDLPFTVKTTLADQQGQLLVQGQTAAGNVTMALLSADTKVIWSLELPASQELSPVIAVQQDSSSAVMWLVTVGSDLWLYAS
jgi:outer membrane protein assembly factor BamB